VIIHQLTAIPANFNLRRFDRNAKVTSPLETEMAQLAEGF
jgi:hypothetical protein